MLPEKQLALQREFPGAILLVHPGGMERDKSITKGPFSANIAPAGNKTGSKNMKNGMQTLRIRNNEPVVVEEVNDSKVRATEKINELLENFMGINDSDLGKH